MLVLSRKVGQSINLDDGTTFIVVAILGIENGKVSIGIEAPQSVKILRAELIPKIDEGARDDC